MSNGSLQRLTSLGLWAAISAFFSLFIASGALVIGGILLVLLIVVLAVMAGPQFMSAIWLIGSPTVFGFPNEILRPLPFVTMDRLMLIILSAMVFLRIAFTKRYTPFIKLEVLIVLFLGYTFISLLLNTSAERVSQDGWLFFQYALPMSAFIVSRRIVWSDHALRMLLAGLCLTGVFLGVLGILQGLFGIHPLTMSFQTITGGHTGRAYGTFSNAHTFIATLFIFLMLSLMQFSMYRQPFIRFILILAMLVMCAGIFFGQTRAPWIGAALAIFIVFIKDKNIRPLVVVGGVIAVAGGMVALVLMIDQLGAYVYRITDMGTLAGRLAIWATAVNMFAHNLLFGVGFGADAFSLHKPEYITGIGSLTQQYAVFLGVPHNEYLHIAIQLGLVGLVLFLSILFQMVKLLFRQHRNRCLSPLKRQMSLYVGAIIVGLMFNSLFSDTYLQDYFWMAAYFLAGLLAGAYTTDSDGDEYQVQAEQSLVSRETGK